ncbi:LLM class flavin-dependent oxidoreductase [Nocardia miyunensis]|uniref:LLM class flavin-dependent oxidoreductase n=1 Tax=Nocardia miyunensis TaxID=282684 RepID=UPI00082B4CD4|nr:LLM class flavin-dependent oxidoreductase [Nocardia miyunensis]
MSATTHLDTRRWSLFVQVRTGPPAADIYRRAIAVAVEAERLGFATIWFATRHFAAHHAALPTVFPLLAAVAQHTERIRLGSGVVALPFENPVRLVEDAAVTDEIACGRLELGIGKGLGFGLSATVYAGFGLDRADRETLYTERLATVHSLLEHGRVAPDVPLYPDPASLRARVWQSTGNVETARRAARVGDGLLPHANSEANGPGGVERLIDAYLDARGPDSTPRIGATVALLPGTTDADARAIFDEDVRRSPAYYAGKLGDADRYRRELSIRCAGTDRLVAELSDALWAARATEWLFHVPLALEHGRYMDCLQRIARDIVPGLTSTTCT